MKAVYLVFFKVNKEKTLEIGALGKTDFKPGTYIYAGSGRTNVEKRIQRHFSKNKNNHWHIDYFSENAEPFDYFILPEISSFECFMAEKLEKWCEPVESFGASDCECNSHLFYFSQK